MPSLAETARHLLWLAQRDNRIAKRRALEAAMQGDPAARAALQADYQPLINARLDWENPVPDCEPESVVGNHNL